MKKLLFILLLALGFSQTEWTTKYFELEITDSYDTSDNHYYYIPISDITGYDLEIFQISLLGVKDNPTDEKTYIFTTLCAHNDGTLESVGLVGKVQATSQRWGRTDLNTQNHSEFTNSSLSGYGDCSLRIQAYGGNAGFDNLGTFMFLVSAEFPQEDTGYIEDGFEFCVQTGANLLSFPCDNQIGVSESLPPGIENFITDIIGQGVATTYNPALGWVGSLDDFTPGSGYWFKSNSSLCFEYECVEN